MTREDIIAWAREAGLPSDELYHPNLERFAALVAAAAKAEENEVCAKVCEEAHWSLDDRKEFAAAIRARGETK